MRRSGWNKRSVQFELIVREQRGSVRPTCLRATRLRGYGRSHGLVGFLDDGLVAPVSAAAPSVRSAWLISSRPVRWMACSSVLDSRRPGHRQSSPRHAAGESNHTGAVLARRITLDIGKPPFIAHPPAIREMPRHPMLAVSRTARRWHRGRTVRPAIASLRPSISASIEQDEAALGAGDGGVEPPGTILGGAAKAVVNDDVLHCEPCALWQVMAQPQTA